MIECESFSFISRFTCELNNFYFTLSDQDFYSIFKSDAIIYKSFSYCTHCVTLFYEYLFKYFTCSYMLRLDGIISEHIILKKMYCNDIV